VPVSAWPCLDPSFFRPGGGAKLSATVGAVKAGESSSHPQGVALTTGARRGATLLSRLAGLGFFRGRPWGQRARWRRAQPAEAALR